MGGRRRIADDDLQQAEDTVAFTLHVGRVVEFMFHLVTFHVFDDDVRQVAEEDLRRLDDSAAELRERTIEWKERKKDEAGR